jgi:hypothetical protein
MSENESGAPLDTGYTPLRIFQLSTSLPGRMPAAKEDGVVCHIHCRVLTQRVARVGVVAKSVVGV